LTVSGITQAMLWRGAMLALVLACAPVLARAEPEGAAHARTTQGGITTWHLNQDLLAALDIRVAQVEKSLPARTSSKHSSYRQLTFAAQDASGFQLQTSSGLPRAFTGGVLLHDGGMVLEFPGGRADLRGFGLRPHAGAPFALDVVDRQGRAWFTLDHGHYLLEDGAGTFASRYMNLRVSAQFATLLKRPELAALVVGGMDSLSPMSGTPQGESGVCSAPWPGQSGAQADIQMMYQTSDAETGVPDAIHFMRCGTPDGSGGYVAATCTATSTNFYAVFTPDTSLHNVGSAAVSWHGMFTGTFPPYGNDQHPFLVWNLYRVDASGALRQLAASGVKHAFNTLNKTCNCADTQNSYPTCEDSYSDYSNDLDATRIPNYLGPRSEIIPAAGIWGRCESVFDKNCLGRTEDLDGGAQNDFQYRLVVAESDITASLQPGATYYFEYWYVVRDQVNIYDAMGYRPVTFSKSTGMWMPVADTFVNGPVINAWVDPVAPPPGALNSELATPEGHARIAVTTTPLGGGLYRYVYTVMNLDFARGVIDPAHATAPNVHVLSADGFSSFALPISADVTVSNFAFSDLDDNLSNDWTVTQGAQSLVWQAPPGNLLNWGTLYQFSFTANQAPLPASVTLGVATAGSPTSYAGTTLAPLDNTIFQDGFGEP
jgi:hypothetical protein